MRRTIGVTRQEVWLGLQRFYFKDEKGVPLPPEEGFKKIEAIFPRKQVDEELNEGADFVCRHGHCLYFEAYSTIVNVLDYWFFLWDKCLEVQNVYWRDVGETDHIKLILRTQEDLDILYPNWETDTVGGSPTHYCHFKHQLGMGGGHSIKLYPKPDNLGTIELTGTRLPDEINADVTGENTYIALEGIWYQALVDYVIFHLTGDVNKLAKLTIWIESMRTESEHRNREERVVSTDLEHNSLWDE